MLFRGAQIEVLNKALSMTMIEIRFGAENSRRHRMVWTCFKNIVNAKRIIKWKFHFQNINIVRNFKQVNTSRQSVFLCVHFKAVFKRWSVLYIAKILHTSYHFERNYRNDSNKANCKMLELYVWGYNYDQTVYQIRAFEPKKNCPLKSCRLFDYNTYEHIKRLMDKFQ